jgi:hypothetical protein
VFRLSQSPVHGRTLVINAKNRWYVLEDGRFRELETENLKVYMDDSEVIRLIDGVSHELLGWIGLSILFVSPGYSEYKDFKKSQSMEFVMPPWTEKELTIAAPLVRPESLEDMEVRFHKFGGIARYVFHLDQEGLLDAVEAAKTSVTDPVETFELVHTQEAVDAKKYTHRILNMFPKHRNNKPYRGHYLTFGSEFMAEEMYAKLVQHGHDSLKSYLMKNDDSSGLWGKLFEMYCHGMWKRDGGKTLQGTSLQDKSQEYSITTLKGTLAVQYFSKIQDIESSLLRAGSPVYFRPEPKNFPCIDAVFWDGRTLHLLQMTISTVHGIVHAPFVQILTWCHGTSLPYDFVLVVPQTKVHDCSAQSFLTSIKTVHKNPCTLATTLNQFVVGVNLQIVGRNSE